MALPQFEAQGDLPEGVHQATLAEVLARFSHGSPQRERVTGRLRRVFELARATGKLERFIIFGSYITAKSEPQDVDILLVMQDDLQEQDYDADTFPLFDHSRAQRELGVSLFVIRPGFIIGETVDEFIAYWQVKRDLNLRGIVEVVSGD